MPVEDSHLKYMLEIPLKYVCFRRCWVCLDQSQDIPATGIGVLKKLAYVAEKDTDQALVLVW